MSVVNDDPNSVFNLDNIVAEPSPDQTSMFMDGVNDTTVSEEGVTRMHIAHNAESASVSEEEVSNGSKAKILAALAIVGIAGYAAYWVQEPVQLRADVLDGGAAMSQEAPVAPVVANEVAAVAAAPADQAGKKASVDVSLFGFEPAVLKIEKDTTVTWTNTSTENQTIIGSSAEGKSFASPALVAGQTFSYKFDQDASFEYYSTYNPALKATVTVGLGSAAVQAPATSNVTTTPAGSSTDLANAPLLGSAPEVSNYVAASDVLSETVDTTVVAPVVTEFEVEDLKPAAVIPEQLTETGPGEVLYAGLLASVAWFNRKKLVKVFQK
jgi:plastocyanin